MCSYDEEDANDLEAGGPHGVEGFGADGGVARPEVVVADARPAVLIARCRRCAAGLAQRQQQLLRLCRHGERRNQGGRIERARCTHARRREQRTERQPQQQHGRNAPFVAWRRRSSPAAALLGMQDAPLLARNCLFSAQTGVLVKVDHRGSIVSRTCVLRVLYGPGEILEYIRPSAARSTAHGRLCRMRRV